MDSGSDDPRRAEPGPLLLGLDMDFRYHDFYEPGPAALLCEFGRDSCCDDAHGNWPDLHRPVYGMDSWLAISPSEYGTPCAARTSLIIAIAFPIAPET